jgi:hypothetical protein
MIFDSARKAIASLTRKVTRKGTSKKKSKDVGTSKRRRKDGTSEEEEEPDNPNDSNFDPADEAASASFMVDEDEINQGGRNNADIIDVVITQLLEGSGHKESLLLLEMKMFIINPVTPTIYTSTPLCKSKLFVTTHPGKYRTIA